MNKADLAKDVDVRDAIAQNRPDILKQLIDNKQVDVSKNDHSQEGGMFGRHANEYYSPLFFLLTRDWSTQVDEKMNMLRTLLKAGANPNETNFRRQTPLYVAIVKSLPLQVVKELLNAGANPLKGLKSSPYPLLYALHPLNVPVLKEFIAAGINQETLIKIVKEKDKSKKEDEKLLPLVEGLLQ